LGVDAVGYRSVSCWFNPGPWRLDNVRCIAYSVAVNIGAVVVAPMVAFSSFIPWTRTRTAIYTFSIINEVIVVHGTVGVGDEKASSVICYVVSNYYNLESAVNCDACICAAGYVVSGYGYVMVRVTAGRYLYANSVSFYVVLGYVDARRINN